MAFDKASTLWARASSTVPRRTRLLFFRSMTAPR